eukprot:TRINITY_DN1049_c0_g2_i9.p1 TRINITY_DN1049_c0_g2~~TRINITY_DN1049_c0_g2_i9.p1  ORF type:complete len:472 (+),score=57.56 TRINITY_DN1049_c0_g2_i9:105-1520(+)
MEQKPDNDYTRTLARTIEDEALYKKQAEEGDKEAQHELGRIYEPMIAAASWKAILNHGYDSGVRDREAEEWWIKARDMYAKAADQGYAPAQHDLAWLYIRERKSGLYDEAIKNLLTQAAEQELLYGQFLLGCVCFYIEKQYDEAIKWWSVAAEQGCMGAERRLADCYWDGEVVPQDKQKAMELYDKGCLQFGWVMDDFILETSADLHLWEYYKEKRKSRSNENMIAAIQHDAEQGNAQAQHDLACFYAYEHRQLQLPLQKDIGKAIEWWTKAAEQGHAEAQFKLGICYDGEEHWERLVDYDGRLYCERMLWEEIQHQPEIVQKKIKKRHCDELHKADGFCRRLWGKRIQDTTMKDNEKALKWFLKAAEQKHAAAAYHLGLLHGKEDYKNEAEAISWLHKAVEWKDERAEVHLLQYYGIAATEEGLNLQTWHHYSYRYYYTNNKRCVYRWRTDHLLNKFYRSPDLAWPRDFR